MTIAITLPWPPSINTYYRSVKIGQHCRVLISADGRKYRRQVEAAVLREGANQELTGRLSVDLFLTPPDRRRRDIDNSAKALLDALEHAGVFRDDEQIDRLKIGRSRETVEGGRVDVRIEEMEGE